MFFPINEIGQVAHRTDYLHNQKKPSNPMVLGIYRIQSRTAIFTVYSRKTYGEFWDGEARKNSQPLLDTRNESICQAKSIGSTLTTVYF